MSGPERQARLRAAVALIAGVALAVPPVAAAADATPTPSAKELWRTYPLHATPDPGQPAAAQAKPQPGKSDTTGSGGTSIVPVLLIAGALVAGTGLFGFSRRARRRRTTDPGHPTRHATARGANGIVPPRVPDPPPPAPPPHAPDPPPAREQEQERVRAGEGAATRRPLPQAPRGTRSNLRPPDPKAPWTAEIAWHEAEDRASFRVEARTVNGPPVPIAKSRPLEWPPSDARAVEALTRTAERLTAALLASGWQQLPDGDAWYAKRFAWNATAESRPPRPTPRPAPRPRRQQQQQWAWADGTHVMWRCEVTWADGYARSRFRAIAYPPGKRRGRAVAESESFHWMPNAAPDPRNPEQVTEARRLADALLAAGWLPTEPGPEWYAARFVWPGPGAPPDEVPLPDPEQVGSEQ